MKKTGYELRRVSRNNSSAKPDILPQPVAENPIEAIYDEPTTQSYSFNCNIEYCLNVSRFGFGPSAWHPFVAFLKEYHDSGQSEFKNSVLEKYYRGFQPESANEALFFGKTGSDTLGAYPPWGAVPPWSRISPNEKILIKKQRLRKRHKSDTLNDLNQGTPKFGPVSNKKAEYEIKRLIHVYESIRDQGYLRRPGKDGDICGTVLFKDSEFRVIISNGHHRLSALAALGYDSVPVRLNYLPVVEERDVNVWPLVKKGIWDKDSAIRYFNLCFTTNGLDWARVNGIIDY